MAGVGDSAPIVVRARLRLFASPMLGDRLSCDFRKSVDLSANMGVTKIGKLALTIIQAQLPPSRPPRKKRID